MKNPVLVEAGRAGARKRWGRRIVRLDSLEPTVRAVILNLVETSERIAREKAVTEGQSPVTAEPGGQASVHPAA